MRLLLPLPLPLLAHLRAKPPTLLRPHPHSAAIASAARLRSPDFSPPRDERPPPPFAPLTRHTSVQDLEEGSEASDIRGSSSSSSSSTSSSRSSSNSSSSSARDTGQGLRPPTEVRAHASLDGSPQPGPALALVLPANLRMGYSSAYPELTTLIARVATLHAMHRPEQCPAAAGLSRLRIGPLLGAGRTWTVYGASAGASRITSSFGEDPSAPGEPSMERRPDTPSPRPSSPAPDFPPLVVKLFSPDIGPFPRAESSARTKESETKANMRAALSEAEMYAGPLRALQGSAVPRYFGLYSGADDDGRWLYALVLERVGRAIHRRRDGGKGSWEELLPQQRRAVAQLYARVHDAGVVHGDMELRHIRRELGEKGGLRLIDFEGARHRPEGVEGERAELDGCIGPEWRKWLA